VNECRLAASASGVVDPGLDGPGVLQAGPASLVEWVGDAVRLDDAADGPENEWFYSGQSDPISTRSDDP
jgi:hypothetical protein